MGEILFRGKRKSNGKWIEGYVFKQFVHCKEEYYIRRYDTDYLVKPKTVGQYTGLTDKNGKRIFEGDIVRSTETSEIGIVQWFTEHSAFMVWCPVPNQVGFLYECSTIVEVVGNVHDNPELLEGE